MKKLPDILDGFSKALTGNTCRRKAVDSEHAIIDTHSLNHHLVVRVQSAVFDR